MKFEMNYDFKGIISVPARALRAKKIIAVSFYLLLALLIYNIFGYLALLLDGAPLSHILSVHRLIPFCPIPFDSVIASVLFYFGVALSIFSIMTGMMAIVGFDFEEMRGNPFFSTRAGLKFSFRRLKQLLLSELAIIAFVAFIIILGIIVGLITRIPYLGEWLYSLFFFFPNFVIALFTVLILFVLSCSVLVMPAAVMADRDGESFNSILETFSTVIRRPLHWVGFTLYSVVAAKVGGFIFAYFAFRAVQFLKISTSLGGGEKINNIVASGMSHLPLNSCIVAFTTNLFPGIPFGFDISSLCQGTDIGAAGYLMAIALFLIFLIIWGYMISVMATGQAYAFAIIKKIRDGHAITDEKSLFYEEEWVNPPIIDDKGTSESNDISR
jgi:hypothetical protein